MDQHGMRLRQVNEVGARLVNRGIDVLQGVAFWMAIAITLLYVPILLQTTPITLGELVAVVGIHAMTLVVGHGHSRV